MIVNPARRAAIIEGALGACVVTGPDKIRCGYGAGDCVLIDLRDLVFALGDATERFPTASRSLLLRFAKRLADNERPASRAGWLELVNSVYARQSYNQKTTFSAVALSMSGERTAFILHGGDSNIIVYDLDKRRVAYRTSADMRFAGRFKELAEVDKTPVPSERFGAIIASDGLMDVIKLSGLTVEGIAREVFRNEEVHRLPERLFDLIGQLPPGSEYDDVGAVAFLPFKLEASDMPPILIGGTSPVQERRYRAALEEGKLPDEWIPIDKLKNMDLIEEHECACIK